MKSRGSVVGTRMHLPPLLLSRGSNSSAKGGDRLVAIGRGWWRRRMAGSCTRYPPVYSALANTGRETCTCSIGEYIGPRVSRTADVLGNGSCRAPSPDSRACVIYIVLVDRDRGVWEGARFVRNYLIRFNYINGKFFLVEIKCFKVI